MQTFTSGDHMVRIEGFDIGSSLGHPVGDDIGCAARAARLISQLPGKDCRGSLVARDNSLDVRLVHALDLLIAVPARFTTSIGSNVGTHATIIIPVIYKGNYKFDTVLPRSRDNIIKTLQTVSTSVYGSSTGGFVVELEVNSSRVWDGVNIIEPPNSENLKTGMFQILEDGVNIRIVGQERQPIRVRASEILRLAVNVELEAIHLGKIAAASGL